ncbi:GNAT family N-acetyltransferase [Pseudocolwellia agarivorans]|uniref:GNAT family N-acetyltransferase n=1 Tax=Pseudocolwellia agarivorans TaxID=1911682 RepID=UPI00098436B0|nr:GNAT family N-acetyltransferase [Pseudocolwellia agarivorans]
MTVEVIKADYHNEQHAKDVLLLLNAYAMDPMGGGEPLCEYTQQHLIENLKQQNNVFSVLVYVDDKPAAIANCVVGFSTFNAKPLVNFHDVAVLKAYRRQGLTQLMFNKVEQIAKEMGCCKLTLEVLEGNTVAKSAYAKQGFAGYELDPKMGQAVFWQKKL